MDRKNLKSDGQTLKDVYAPYYNLGGLVADAENENNYKPIEFDQNFPNPFNPITTIKYSVPSAGNSLMEFIQIKVYDILGNEISSLVDEEKKPGIYQVNFNADKLSSGIYFYTLFNEDKTLTRKMLLLK